MDLENGKAESIRRRLNHLGQQFLNACALEHRAAVNSDAEGRATAHFARLKAAGEYDKELDRIADDFGIGLAHYIDRQPDHFREVMLPALAVMLAPLWVDLKSVATATANLERRVSL